MVYEILSQKDLCHYYELSENPGITRKIKVREGKFAFLDDPKLAGQLVQFSNGRQKRITFYLPQMHCSSCIWLLEQLPKIHKGIISAQVNFLRKELSVVFNTDQITLRKLAETLTEVGYEPHISLNDISGKKAPRYNRARLYKLGIAGFCFGNIMLLSFPEYFSSGQIDEKQLKALFSYLNLGLSLPVFFYCASEFFSSAYKGLRQRFLNIDAPIALAILITFSRSLYEIVGGHGAGYLDSMSGIVFFMLVGRYFQNKSYDALDFDRSYTSYFPVSVTVLAENGTERQIGISQLKKGDRIRIHHNEIIPADCILFLGKGTIDYSFVTGESIPVEKCIGELVYAGGRQTGASIDMEVIKEVSQSYLTQLWNSDVFKKEKYKAEGSFVHRVSRYFTLVLFGIALCTGAYWLFTDPSRALNAVTAVLIVACPCALLLSATFTNGNMMTVLQGLGFYVKNAQVLESISKTDMIVFDKTGTITLQHEARLDYHGESLGICQQQLVRTLAVQSSHPLSKAIAAALPFQKRLPLTQYSETPAQGSSAVIAHHQVKLGSAAFVHEIAPGHTAGGSRVYVSIDGKVMGHYSVQTAYRPGLERVIEDLKQDHALALLSGDNSAEKYALLQYFGPDSDMLFEQQPEQKLEYIEKFQKRGCHVMMVGDGLNDAGALRQSDVGIAITDHANNFSPGSDVIMTGSLFDKLPQLIRFCKKEKPIIYGSFAISVLYNIAGLYFAVQGSLSPVIAAILMPVSSLSIMLYTTGLSRWYGKKLLYS